MNSRPTWATPDLVRDTDRDQGGSTLGEGGARKPEWETNKQTKSFLGLFDPGLYLIWGPTLPLLPGPGQLSVQLSILTYPEYPPSSRAAEQSSTSMHKLINRPEDKSSLSFYISIDAWSFLSRWDQIKLTPQ